MAKRNQPDQPPDTVTDDGRLQPNDHSSRQAIRRRLLRASLGAPMIYTLPHATLAAGSTCIGKPGSVLDAPIIPAEEFRNAESLRGAKPFTQPGAGSGSGQGFARGEGLGLQEDGGTLVRVDGLGEHTIGSDSRVKINGTNYIYQDGQIYTASCATSLGIGVATDSANLDLLR